jgi:cell fate regulator YaaT (PSP1 superfamily)
MYGPPELRPDVDLAEIRFKNKRSDFYKNSRLLKLRAGDRVVVAEKDGFDIGTVALASDQAMSRFRKLNPENISPVSLNSIIRIADHSDINVWLNARKLDRPALLKCNEIASSLNMKIDIHDVEFRADTRILKIFYTSERQQDIERFKMECMEILNIGVEIHDLLSAQAKEIN